MNKRLIITIIIIIFILLLLLTFILYFPVLYKNFFIENGIYKEQNNLYVQNKEKIDEKKLKNDKIDQNQQSFENKNTDLSNDTIIKDKNLINTNENKKYYTFNEVDFKNINFNALGNYVSEEERQYRLKVLQSLKIKTVIINYVTSGNGISQEFYKVVYLEKMIPAKILDEIVESREFRNLIPSKYLMKEEYLKNKNQNIYVKFSNQSIRELLILWCNGKLTPVKKAWETKAIK